MGAELVLRSPGNSHCFDCETDCSSNAWASMAYGTVLCPSCAEAHQGTISFVRAFDALREEEVNVMLRGGNNRFAEFLEAPSYNVPRQVWLAIPLDMRYHTPVADLYRRRFRAELAGDEVPENMEAVRPPPAYARSDTRSSCSNGYCEDLAKMQSKEIREHFVA